MLTAPSSRLQESTLLHVSQWLLITGACATDQWRHSLELAGGFDSDRHLASEADCYEYDDDSDLEDFEASESSQKTSCDVNGGASKDTGNATVSDIDILAISLSLIRIAGYGLRQHREQGTT